MYHQTGSKKHSVIGQIIPAYGFYDRMGEGLAEGLVNILEKFFGLIARFRR
jgi:hypothetical protein